MYCSNMYCSSLWCTYSQSTYKRVHVAYNNALRILLKMPKFCSASEMFVTNNLCGFDAQMRKQRFSLYKRVYMSSNKLVSLLVKSDVQFTSKLFSLTERTLHGQ